MDYRNIFADSKVAEEFLDRYPELAGGGGGAGLESMEDELEFSVDQAAAAVKTIQESSGEVIDPGLEAIILRFGRPAYFVQDKTFDTADQPSSSAEVDGRVNGARAIIEGAIPSVGRINLRNHRMPWVGTGWIVAPNVLVTNRHVARTFAERENDEFVFVETIGRKARASLDTFQEHRRSTEAVFRLRKALWIEPASGHDVAFFQVDETGEDDEDQPPPIALMNAADYDALPVQTWTAVIGYPARSIHNNAQDQQRIFEGVFDVKRLQPGTITAKQTDILEHDATTLGGNSGSTVIDLASGQAVALHFGGLEGQTNKAVPAPVVARLLEEKVG